MTKHEVTSCLAFLQKLEELDVAGLLRQTYPDRELSETFISELSASDFMTTLKRVIATFREALNDSSVMIPRYAYVGNLGNVDLVQDFQALTSYVTSRNWTAAEQHLGRVVPFLMMIGYWTRPTDDTLLVDQNKARELLAQVEVQVADSVVLLKSLKVEEAGLKSQVTVSRAELEAITESLSGAKGDAAQVKTTLTTAQAHQQELTQIKTNWTTHSDDAEEAKTSLNQQISSLADQTTKLLQRINIDLTNAGLLNDNATKTHSWIESKREDIIKLTGLAADGSLGHSFNQRKVGLVAALSYWKTASIWASIAVVVYVFCVYLLIPIPDNPVLAVVTGVGKVLPVLLVYGFVLRQYSRERSFLEEYEFKAAVALVVNAYADQLAPPKLNVDDFKDAKALQEYLREKENERRKLISDTVTKLFTPPHIHTEKSANVLTAFRPKAMVDVVREVKSLTEELKK